MYTKVKVSNLQEREREIEEFFLVIFLVYVILILNGDTSLHAFC